MISEIASFHQINTTRLFSSDMKAGNVTTVAGIKVFYKTNGKIWDHYRNCGT